MCSIGGGWGWAKSSVGLVQAIGWRSNPLAWLLWAPSHPYATKPPLYFSFFRLLGDSVPHSAPLGAAHLTPFALLHRMLKLTGGIE